MRLLSIGLALACAAIGFADTLTLRSGRVIQGTYLGGSARQVRVDVGDRIETLDVSDVSRIDFNSSAASAPALPPPSAPPPEPVLVRRSESNVFRPDTEPVAAPPPARWAGELASGTNMVVRLIDGVDSETSQLGQTFQASLDEPIMINGDTVVPRGADVVAKLVEDKQSGKISGRTELTLDLASIRVNGKMVDITTGEVTTASGSRGAKSAKVIGGATAVGAVLGGIFGGGKGAAIGAASGAGAGGAVQVLTKGQKVKIPAETRLSFTLQNDLKI